METEIEYKGIELLVEGTYTPGEPEITYFNDMSGLPASASEFDVNAVFVEGVDIYELLSWDDIEKIVDLVINKIEDND